MHLPRDKEIEFDPTVSIAVTLIGGIEIRYTGISSMFVMNNGMISLKKTDGNVVEIKDFLTFEVDNGDDSD